MPAIHQLVAGFSHGDAISNESLMLREIFRTWGCESQIFCEGRRILPELRNQALDLAQNRAAFGERDVVLLHLSIGSVVNELFACLPGRKAILYHNITPPRYFAAIQEQIARNLALGLEQARMLAGKAEVVMADSRFNAGELEAMGHRDVRVLPLVLDLRRVREKPARATLRKYDDGLVNVLFVGRCVPNKRLEDCLYAFYYFQKYIEPNSRFIHAGSYAGTEQYHALLITMVRDLQLRNVEFAGSVRQDELVALYKSSRLFLCMSEHEGFCIPVLEAMANEVPVLASAAAAVPETMDGAGVLLHEKRFDLAAEMMGRLVRDEPLRRAVIEGQRERIARYESLDLAREIRGFLAPLLS